VILGLTVSKTVFVTVGDRWIEVIGHGGLQAALGIIGDHAATVTGTASWTVARDR